MFIYELLRLERCDGWNAVGGSQEIDHQRIDPFGNLGLYPMAGIGNPFESKLGNPSSKPFGQANAQITVMLPQINSVVLSICVMDCLYGLIRNSAR